MLSKSVFLKVFNPPLKFLTKLVREKWPQMLHAMSVVEYECNDEEKSVTYLVSRH